MNVVTFEGVDLGAQLIGGFVELARAKVPLDLLKVASHPGEEVLEGMLIGEDGRFVTEEEVGVEGLANIGRQLLANAREGQAIDEESARYFGMRKEVEDFVSGLAVRRSLIRVEAIVPGSTPITEVGVDRKSGSREHVPKRYLDSVTGTAYRADIEKGIMYLLPEIIPIRFREVSGYDVHVLDRNKEPQVRATIFGYST